MPENFLVVFKDSDGDVKTHFYDETRLYAFLNNNAIKAEQGEYDEESGDLIEPYVIRTKLPIPPEEWRDSIRYGEYCIANQLGDNEVLIIREDGAYVPESRPREKTITVTEYGPPQKAAAPRTRSRKATKKSRK